MKAISADVYKRKFCKYLILKLEYLMRIASGLRILVMWKGNLVLISKKKKYLDDRVDAFKANKVFLEVNSVWTPEVLGNRQDYLVDILVENVKANSVELLR